MTENRRKLTRSKPANLPETNSTLPVPASESPARSTAPYLAVTDWALRFLDDVIAPEYRDGHPTGRTIIKSKAQAEAALPTFQGMKAKWAALDRPTTVTQVQVAAGRLSCQRDPSNNIELFSSALLEHLTVMEATAVELDWCCFIVEAENRFIAKLSIGDVYAAMEKAKQKVARVRRLFKMDLAEAIDDNEERSREQEERAQEKRREEAEDWRRRLAKLTPEQQARVAALTNPRNPPPLDCYGGSHKLTALKIASSDKLWREFVDYIAVEPVEADDEGDEDGR